MYRYALSVVIFLLGAAAGAQETEPYSPYVGQDFPKNVYFGDTHLHTSLSFDAFGDGNTSKSPEEAYRFAKGEENSPGTRLFVADLVHALILELSNCRLWPKAAIRDRAG